MKVIDPALTATKDMHQYLLGAVSPRPIAFASTLGPDGVPNLAPYSFFNCFSSNPPTVVFSSNRRGTDASVKDTLRNVEATGEVVINAVNYNIVRQMALASIDYPASISEFSKAGLTPIASDLVKPFRVKESPAHLECKVRDIITLGDQGGAGHLIICDVARMHISEEVLDENGKINPHKIDLMGRMGRAFYVRASGEAIHKIVQPVNVLGIGFDELPAGIRNSKVLTGNNLGMLASIPQPPAPEEALRLKEESYIQEALNSPDPVQALHLLAQKALAREEVALAARIAWLSASL
ncbi:flavin reductase family protein [Phaeodactylibacter luteus]|uniref:Flavin reductase family protein n=1 Tax=Phaeodactylibacter luteus TaxID=1564516 RepID=A0A5C6RLH2_9BACT|nr:flavin reductase family protein [Phaeodactylibacter luteus]TXB63103.1 flavin reductase family protein [Phaeodactylibacter luteus]